jgi:Protein of unknown function (DUF3618)
MTNDDRSSAEIERDIEREREELQDTLQEIRDRYSVESITRQVGRYVQENGSDIGRSVMEQVKANPIPLALTGIGLAWLMAGGGSRATDQQYRYRDRFAGYRSRAMSGSDYDYRRDEFGPEYYDEEQDWSSYDFDEDDDEWASQGEGRSGWSSVKSGVRSMAHKVGDMASDVGEKASDMAASVTSGMGSGSRSRSRGYYDDDSWYTSRSRRARRGMRKMRASAGEMMSRMYEGTQDMTEEARQRVVAAREAAYNAQKQLEDMVRRGQREMADLFGSQPLVVGALAMAAGAAIGGLLPRTDMEDAAMGDERDRLLEEAERIYRQEREKAGAVVGAAASAATEVLREARDEITSEGEDGESAVDTVAQKTKEAAGKVVERTRAEAERQGLGDVSKGASSPRGTSSNQQTGQHSGQQRSGGQAKRR